MENRFSKISTHNFSHILKKNSIFPEEFIENIIYLHDYYGDNTRDDWRNIYI